MRWRAHVFHGGFWALSGGLAPFAALTALLPTRQPLVVFIWLYTRLVVAWLRVCGVRVRWRGFERLKAGPLIVAAKHQSYGDGITLVARNHDLAYVIGDHMLRFPLVGFILGRAEAVVVDNAGGRRIGRGLERSLARIEAEGRDVLIFPEGGMSPAGEKKRYRKGVWKLYEQTGRAVVPVATNLGCFWPEQAWRLEPGEATVEALDPIPPGLGQAEFMARLERAIETRTAELVAEARGLAGDAGPERRDAA